MPQKPLYNELDGMFGRWHAGHWRSAALCCQRPPDNMRSEARHQVDRGINASETASQAEKFRSCN